MAITHVLRLKTVFITLGILVSTFTVATSRLEVKWLDSPNRVNMVAQGGQVTIKCHISDVTSSQFDKMKLSKNQLPVDADSESPMTDISVMNGINLVNAFRQTKRLWPYYNVDATSRTETLHLNITNFQPEDNGMYRCEYKNLKTDYIMFVSKAAITEVYFKQKLVNQTEIKVPDGATVTARKSEQGGVGCYAKVKDSLIEPRVMIKVDNKPVEDSDDFKNHTMVVFTDTQTTGLFKMDIYRSVQYYGDDLDQKYNGRQLRCEAYTESHKTPVQTATVTLMVETEPEVTCPGGTKFYSRAGRPVSVTCVVQSNPAGDVYVMWGTNGDENRLSPGVQEGELSLGTKTTQAQYGEKNVTFTISNVVSSHFGYKYRISASNSYGMEYSQLTLIEGDPPGGPTTGVATVGSNTLLVVFSSFVLVLLALVFS